MTGNILALLFLVALTIMFGWLVTRAWRAKRAIARMATMMVAEIVGGIVFGSMALLADGWQRTGIGMYRYEAACDRLHPAPGPPRIPSPARGRP